MKINKQKLHLKQSQVVRRGSSHTLPLELSCRPSRKKVVTFHPSGERKNGIMVKKSKAGGLNLNPGSIALLKKYF